MTRLRHLIRRFFGSLRARRPGPDDQRLVAGVLSDAEATAFWSQPVPDLAHAVRSARLVGGAVPDRVDLMRAALLHDLGKRRSSTGTISRSMATGLAALHLPTTQRQRLYLDHARLGAEELASLGCEPLVVEFARHHHRDRPAAIDREDWTTLVIADDE